MGGGPIGMGGVLYFGLELALLVLLTVFLFYVFMTNVHPYNFSFRLNPISFSAREAIGRNSRAYGCLSSQVYWLGMRVCNVGCGAQMLSISTSVMLMALLGMFNVHQHGRLNAALVLLYAFTSGIAGFVSAYYFRLFNGTNWVANVNITSILFMGTT